MEERPQVWKAVANILNKQWPTADKGWSSNWGGGGLGEVLTTPRRKKKYLVTKCSQRDRDRWRALVNAIMIRVP
jgi:hypothetical protein